MTTVVTLVMQHNCKTKTFFTVPISIIDPPHSFSVNISDDLIQHHWVCVGDTWLQPIYGLFDTLVCITCIRPVVGSVVLTGMFVFGLLSNNILSISQGYKTSLECFIKLDHAVNYSEICMVMDATWAALLLSALFTSLKARPFTTKCLWPIYNRMYIHYALRKYVQDVFSTWFLFYLWISACGHKMIGVQKVI